jgi:hypothetical protein
MYFGTVVTFGWSNCSAKSKVLRSGWSSGLRQLSAKQLDLIIETWVRIPPRTPRIKMTLIMDFPSRDEMIIYLSLKDWHKGKKMDIWIDPKRENGYPLKQAYYIAVNEQEF